MIVENEHENEPLTDSILEKSASNYNNTPAYINRFIDQETTSDMRKEHLLSLANTIEEEITMVFKSRMSLFHIYYRINSEESKFEIFIRLHRNSLINPQSIHHFFLITLTSVFPHTPPYITCISNLFSPSLNDQRDLLSCIYPDWKISSKLSDVIENIPQFLVVCENDFRNSLFFFYGGYILNDYQYSINDFLMNSFNRIYRVKLIIDDCFGNEDYYLVLTDCKMLLFDISPDDKSKGSLVLVVNLRAIVDKTPIKPKGNNRVPKDKVAFVFKWDETIETYDYGFVIDEDVYEELHEEIRKRVKNIVNRFYLIYDKETCSLETIEQIVKLKEISIAKQFDCYTFHLLTELYQKAIEIYTEVDKERIAVYIGKLQELMLRFHKFNNRIGNK